MMMAYCVGSFIFVLFYVIISAVMLCGAFNSFILVMKVGGKLYLWLISRLIRFGGSSVGFIFWCFHVDRCLHGFC